MPSGLVMARRGRFGDAGRDRPVGASDPAGVWQVAFRGHGGESHSGKVGPGLEDHVAGLPGRVELRVELEQVVQLQGQQALEAQ